MPPKSPGRTPKWKPEEIKQAWKDLRAENPIASKTDLARLLKMSLSRVRAIINNHPSEQQRKEKKSEAKPLDTSKTDDKQVKPESKKQELIFFPWT